MWRNCGLIPSIYVAGTSRQRSNVCGTLRPNYRICNGSLPVPFEKVLVSYHNTIPTPIHAKAAVKDTDGGNRAEGAPHTKSLSAVV